MTLHEDSFVSYSSYEYALNGNNDTLKNSYRLVILGAPKVGKTCIVNWFLGNTYRDNYIPTIEDFHQKVYKIRNEIYRLDILDTSGNDPFPAMKNLNIMIGDLFVLVFSIDDIDSYMQVKSLCDQIIEVKKHNKQDGYGRRNAKFNVPILIIGNKLDYLLDQKIQSRCVESSDVQKYLSTFKSCIYYETSCKNCMGLDRAFEKYFNYVNLPIEMIPSKHHKMSVNLDLTKPLFSRMKQHFSSKSHVSSPIAKANNGNTPSHVSEIESNNEVPSRLSRKKRNSSKKYNSGNNNQATSTATASTTDPEITNNAVNSNGSLNESNGYTFERSNSFKDVARRSFRRMTFRRQTSEAYGAAWLNARRPSIRAELNLLQAKTTHNFQMPRFNTNVNQDNINNRRNNTIIQNFYKLFCCHSAYKSPNSNEKDYEKNRKFQRLDSKNENKNEDDYKKCFLDS